MRLVASPLALALALFAGCNAPSWTSLPAPIPVALSGGALTAFATVDGIDTPFATVIDTGSPLTAYDAHEPAPSARRGVFRLFSAATPPVARFEIRDITLFETPLRSVGLDPAAAPVGGVLGGDNLSRFVVGLDYRATPTVSLFSTLQSCSCELASDCDAVFPFTLAGGQNAIALGQGVYSYPPTRVLLDACLEPLADPISRNEVCSTSDGDASIPPTAPYLASGIDVKVIVSTGFPGFAVSSGAFDRLRGQGAAEALLAGAGAEKLHLPDPSDDGADGSGLTVAAAALGGFQTAALALVSRELYFGPCEQLARSRRQRRFPPGANIPEVPPSECVQNNLTPKPEWRYCERACLQTGLSPNALDQACLSQVSSRGLSQAVCDDASPQSPTASVVELEGPLPTYVLSDTAPLLQGISSDVQPNQPEVEAVIGTEVLKRLTTTIDYPNRRVVARCAEGADCLTYPRFIDADECGYRCAKPAAIFTAPNPGGACAPAP